MSNSVNVMFILELLLVLRGMLVRVCKKKKKGGETSLIILLLTRRPRPLEGLGSDGDLELLRDTLPDGSCPGSVDGG